MLAERWPEFTLVFQHLYQKTYGNLIKPSSIIIKALKDDGTLDEKVQERLDAILEDNQWHTLSKKGVITESWGGFFFLKMSYMEGYKYPIIELVDMARNHHIFNFVLWKLCMSE